MIIIVASALGALGFSAVLAVALGRAAALADRSSEKSLAERRANPVLGGYRQSYAGFSRARTRVTIARRSSITGSSSRAL